MSEVWKDLPGYEGFYQVSDLGRVRSLDREHELVNRGVLTTRRIKGKLRCPSPSHGGYLAFLASKPGTKPRSLKVHISVLQAHVGPRPAGHDGCHNDGDVTNNTLLNLRWDTKSNNNADKAKHGTAQIGAKNPAAKLTAADVAIIRTQLPTRTLKAIAADYGVTLQTIHNIKSGKTWFA